MRRKTALTVSAVYVVAALFCILLLFIMVLPLEDTKTRQDHMDQLNRIESKVDQLIEIGDKWQ